jgi:hypothetical protein
MRHLDTLSWTHSERFGAGTAELSHLLQRRALLRGMTAGLGTLALNSLLQPELLATPSTGAGPGVTHFAPKARRVIFMHMVGAPSQLDLFDYKPILQKHDRQLCPDEFIKGKRFAFIRGHPKLLGTRYRFDRCGAGGTEISELLPHLQTVADDICVVRSMTTQDFNHGPAQLFFHTGLNRPGNPSVGSWVSYGLGSPNASLPAYVVFVSGKIPGAGSALWGNGFLPSIHQGIEFRSAGEPVLFLNNPQGVDADRRRRIIDGVQALNQQQLAQTGDPEIVTRMGQYEMAFRMQASVPELMNLRDEPKHVMDMYGEGEFARQCIYARRLAERGVRFIELFHADWDTHGNQHSRLSANCRAVDRPMAALVKDLKQRGLLEDTLIVWAGEFGRTPMLQGSDKPDTCGRDHHKEAFSIWLAGGGIKGGTTYGATDEMGYYVTQNPVKVRDLHATLLHQLGLDHEKVTFRFQGLDQKLTGVEEAHVQRGMLA